MNISKALSKLSAKTSVGVKHGLIYACMMTMALGAFAQDLSTEITVDRIVEPKQREAVRPTLVPIKLSMPQLHAAIEPVEYRLSGTIISPLHTLAPVMWGDTVEKTPYKGYASIGYFPINNIGANAGYRFLDTKNLSAGAWMQYDGNSYKSAFEQNDYNATAYPWKTRKLKLGGQEVNVGAYGTFNPNIHSSLSVNADYKFASILQPWSKKDDSFSRGANQVGVKASWVDFCSKFSYNASASLQRFAFTKSDFTPAELPEASPLAQTWTSISAGIGRTRAGENHRYFGVDFNLDLLHTDADEMYFSSDNRVVGSLRPYVVVGKNAFKALIGLKGEILESKRHSKGYFLPEVRIWWAPVTLPFSAYMNFNYSSNINPASQLFVKNPYFNSFSDADNSTDIILDAGFNLGKISGVTFSLCGGVARNVDNIRPVLKNSDENVAAWDSEYGGNFIGTLDFTSWKLGATASYEYKALGKAALGLFYGGADDYDFSWYEWLDNARWIFTASVDVRPIEKLNVGLGYELHATRNALTEGNGGLDLKDLNNLTLNASYAVSPAITAFLRCENMLNSHYLMAGGLPAQGIKGLFGATIKF